MRAIKGDSAGLCVSGGRSVARAATLVSARGRRLAFARAAHPRCSCGVREPQSLHDLRIHLVAQAGKTGRAHAGTTTGQGARPSATLARPAKVGGMRCLSKRPPSLHGVVSPDYSSAEANIFVSVLGAGFHAEPRRRGERAVPTKGGQASASPRLRARGFSRIGVRGRPASFPERLLGEKP